MQQAESRSRNIKELAITIVGNILCLYVLATTLVRVPILQHRALYLLIVLALVFLLYPSSRRRARLSLGVDLTLIALSLISVGYVALYYSDLIMRYYSPSVLDMAFGVITIILVLEATRRTVGLPMCIVALFFLAYTFFGKYVPGYFGHPGYPVDMVIGYIYQTMDGLFGTVLGVAAAEVAVLTVFGSLLNVGGGGRLFSDVGRSLLGKSVGGGLKGANIAAYLLGMVAGSSGATAIMTYSMMKDSIDEDMKKVGRDSVAGYIAAIGTGAFISPPVMGAVAFVMAYVAGIPYVEICKMAILITLLYYLTLFVMIDITARRSGLSGLPPEKIPKLGDALKTRGHMFLPIVLLVVLLSQGFTPVGSAFWACVSTVALSMVRKETRMMPKAIVMAFKDAAKAIITIATVCACAGIVVAPIMLTGLGIKLSIAIGHAAEVHLVLALLIAMVTAIILGMGLPPTPVYLLVAVLIAPALIRLGVPAAIAHFFVFYYACFSVLTPPVASTSYAMAGILKANPFKSGWISMKMILPILIIPIMLPYAPELLLIGSWESIALRFAVWVAAIFALAIGIEGYTPLWGSAVPTWLRALFFVDAALLIFPQMMLDAVGIVLFAVLMVVSKKAKRESLKASGKPQKT
ncbi:MAG: TRAP transporter fused permease subunit [Candidatus Nezhaarchaeota archaeon]|nr:TRAP transporter fused permease subunit [Candidatus Nezhaarchaeota archaeon]